MKITLPSGLNVFVDYKYKNGTSDSYWVQGDPPEVSIEKVYLDDKEIQLMDNELEFIELYILEHHVPEDDFGGYRGDD